METTFISVLRQIAWWFSLGTPVSSTNKTDRHDIIEILLKVPLNTITLTLNISMYFGVFNIGTSYLGAKIGQNNTMTKISRFTVLD
jgi:hypothetical protein